MSVISQPLDDGQDFTVMDWISEANKRKHYIHVIQWFKDHLTGLSFGFSSHRNKML